MSSSIAAKTSRTGGLTWPLSTCRGQLNDIAGDIDLADLARELDADNIAEKLDVSDAVREFFQDNTFSIRA